MVNRKLEGHKKRIETRKAKGWWQSPDAKENMKIARLKWIKENPEKFEEQKRKVKDSIYCKFTGFRQFMKKIDKIKIPKINKCRCGNYFKYKDKRNVFCSKECRNKRKRHPYGHKMPNMVGPKNPAWNGGTAKLKYKRFTKDGKHYYVHIENCLKKHGLESLPAGYCVHHIDRDRFNNNPENLLLMKIEDHNKFHAKLMKKN